MNGKGNCCYCKNLVYESRFGKRYIEFKDGDKICLNCQIKIKAKQLGDTEK